MGNFSTFSNSGYRYTFEKGSRKHHCPSCSKRRFVRYIDLETGEYLPPQYGRCDRESQCGYQLNPYSDGHAKTMGIGITGITQITVPKQKIIRTAPRIVHFDHEIFKRTLGNYRQNTFIQNLLENVAFPFDAGDVTKVIELYYLGTVATGYRAGAVTFPFIDVDGNVRTVQVKQFDQHNHTTGTDFLHSIIEKHHTRNNEPLPGWLKAYINQDKRVTCLFGEHLLRKYPHNPVALVEAPKTAIYGTLYFGPPKTSNELIWLAVYNKSSFSIDKMKALKGRFVYVFPDLSKDGGTFKEWEAKAQDFEVRLPGTQFVFSDLLERLAKEQDKQEGNDLADYLIQLDWRLFRTARPGETPNAKEDRITESTQSTHPEHKIFSATKGEPEDVELWYGPHGPYLWYNFKTISFKEIGYRWFDWPLKQDEIKNKVKSVITLN